MKFTDFLHCFRCLWKTYKYMSCYKPSDICNFRHGFLYLFSTFVIKMRDFPEYFISYSAVDNLWKTCGKPV